MKLHLLVYPKLSLSGIISSCNELEGSGEHVAIVINGGGGQEVLDWSQRRHDLHHVGDGEYSVNARGLVHHNEIDGDLETYMHNWLSENRGLIFEGHAVQHEIVEEIIEEEIVGEDDELLHEHENGVIHSHEGGNESHEHEEDLEDEEVEDNDVSDSSDSGSGSNPWVWGNQSS